MVRLELILLNGFGDPEGNRLLDRLEKHTGLVGDPRQREHSRLYHHPADTVEDAETQISAVFEKQLQETTGRDSLGFGVQRD